MEQILEVDEISQNLVLMTMEASTGASIVHFNGYSAGECFKIIGYTGGKMTYFDLGNEAIHVKYSLRVWESPFRNSSSL